MNSNTTCPCCRSALSPPLSDYELAARLYSLSIQFALRAHGCDTNGLGMRERLDVSSLKQAGSDK